MLTWARDYSKCIVCGREDRPHMAKGKCSYCYSAEYQKDPKNESRVREQKHNHYHKSGGSALSKVKREERWFDSRRSEVLQRDNFKCRNCSEHRLSRLVVHHEDGNGRGSSSPNNDLDNLVTLCRSCHASHHSKSVGWSRSYSQCLSCGTTDRKHNAKGLCWQCYMAKSYQQNKV